MTPVLKGQATDRRNRGPNQRPAAQCDQLWVIPGAELWVIAITVGATADPGATVTVATAIPDRSGAATPTVKAIFWARVRAICMATPYTAIGTGDPVVTE